MILRKNTENLMDRSIFNSYFEKERILSGLAKIASRKGKTLLRSRWDASTQAPREIHLLTPFFHFDHFELTQHRLKEKSFSYLLFLPTQLQDLSHPFEMTDSGITRRGEMVVISNTSPALSAGSERNLSVVFCFFRSNYKISHIRSR